MIACVYIVIVYSYTYTEYLQQTRDKYNTDISTTLNNLGGDLFQAFYIILF